MLQQKRILLADDEVIFLKATSKILQDNGYTCDCASDAKSVLEMLRSNDYDLLISDIKMPGNSDMELISKITEIADGMPVILVTAYPSIDNTIQAIKFRVHDYLLKPVDFEELLERVNDALSNVSISQDITREAQKSINKWKLNVDNVEKLISKTSIETPLTSLNSYLDISFNNMFETLMSLRNMTKSLVIKNDDKSLYNLKGCVQPGMLIDALVETVAILKKTKDAFKSKDLGMLRSKLERLLAEIS